MVVRKIAVRSLIVLALLGSVASESATLPLAVPAAPGEIDESSLPPISSNRGQVIFFRPSALSFVIFGCDIKEGERSAANLGSGEFTVSEYEPGEILLHTRSSQRPLRVVIAAGERYYIKCTMRSQLLFARPTISRSSAEEFGDVFASLNVADM